MAILGIGRRPRAAVAATVTAAAAASAVQNFEPAVVSADTPEQPPSERAQDRPESWQNNDFWNVQKPSALAPLLPTRTRAWQKTTDKVREQLDLVLSNVVSEPANVRLREQLADSVKTATCLAFDNRSNTALRSSIATLSAGWTAVLVGAALAIVACIRWQLAWPQVFLILAAQAAFFALAYAFEKYVFPGVLHWGFGSSRWSHTPRLYARTIIYLSIGIGAMITVLTLADRHHHLTWLEHLALAAPLGCLAVAAGLWTAVGVAALGELVRPPQDPYPELVTSLLEADYRLRVVRAGTTNVGASVLPASERIAVATVLERSARALAADSGLCAPIDGAFNGQVTGALRADGAKVAVWLRNCERDILAPNCDTGTTALESLDAGFKSACQANWAGISAEPPADAAGQQSSWAARWIPRIVVTAFLIAAAFGIPAVLGKTLSSGAGTTLTVTLILSALTALAAPSTAVSSVASDISGLVKPS